MRWFVHNSSIKTQANDPIDYSPFRLDALTEKQPSFFEVVFLHDGILYRYGFEISREKVETEWLFHSPHAKEAKLFTREDSKYTISRNLKGGTVSKQLTRPNALFLSVAAQFNNQTAIKILDWFTNLGMISGLDDSGYGGFTAKMFSEDESYRSSILELIQGSDVGINDIVTEKTNIKDPSAFPQNMPQELKDFFTKQMKADGEIVNFKSTHSKRCKNGAMEETRFDIGDESEGTQKLFFLSGPIIDTLQNGKVLVIDEIEARMHTLLTRKLTSLFNSPITNPKHAQLIFATHDTNLLSKELFRRDQIWFVEKDMAGASHLYSLAELKVKNERIYENDYLQGRYGAIPVLGDLRTAVLDLSQDDPHASK